MVGYGARPPDPHWPGGANLCLTIAVNYETGGENSILHGDSHSEGVLTDTGFPPYEGARNMIVESAFEYGSRRGFWRIMRILDERGHQDQRLGRGHGAGAQPAKRRAPSSKVGTRW